MSRLPRDIFDNETGFEVCLFGSGFKYDEGGLIKGNVEKIQFMTEAGDAFVTVTDFNLSAAKINDRLTGGTGVAGLLNKLLEHDDTITGTSEVNVLFGKNGDDFINAKAGADIIVGNEGDDVMKGGLGDDTFRFFANSGNDVITDFKVGNEETFDLIFIRDIGFILGKTSEGDLKIKFEDGGSVILEGVDFSQRNDVHFDAVSVSGGTGSSSRDAPARGRSRSENGRPREGPPNDVLIFWFRQPSCPACFASPERHRLCRSVRMVSTRSDP